MKGVSRRCDTKILLVEDDAATVESVEICIGLRHPEIKIVDMNDGLKALDALKTDRFDVVMIDLGLPDIDGLRLAKAIRRFSNVPILIVSGRYSAEVIDDVTALGASGYIQKPFNFHVLMNALNGMVNRRLNRLAESAQLL